MGLLVPPPQSPGPQGSSVLVGVANQRFLNSWLVAKGMVFAATGAASFPRIYRWKDPYAVAASDALAISDIFLVDTTAICASIATNKLYSATSRPNGAANEVTAVQMDMDTFATSTEVVAQEALGNADSASVDTSRGGLACDGTFLYYLLSTNAQNSWIGKFALSDGSLAAQFQLPNPTSGNAFNGGVLLYDGAGSLYAAGGSGAAGGWAAKVPVALGSATMLNFGQSGSFVGAQAFLDANGFWVTDALSAPSSAYKIALDLSGATQINTPRSGQVNGICEAADPAFFWITQGNTTTVPLMTLYDKATRTVRKVVEGPVVPGQYISFLAPLDRANFWLTQAPSTNAKPGATITPTWQDLSVTPAPPAGRGAGW